jgi:antitoxin ParD1/3/4
MDVTLPPEMERFVRERVATGEYASASAVIREGLRLLQERDREHASRFAELRAAIDEGLAAAERGDVIGGEEAFSWLRDRRGGRQIA